MLKYLNILDLMDRLAYSQAEILAPDGQCKPFDGPLLMTLRPPQYAVFKLRYDFQI